MQSRRSDLFTGICLLALTTVIGLIAWGGNIIFDTQVKAIAGTTDSIEKFKQIYFIQHKELIQQVNDGQSLLNRRIDCVGFYQGQCCPHSEKC